MTNERARLLFVPGWNGSGDSHWQTLWERRLGGQRVEQRDWASPCPQKWVRTLDRVVRSDERPTILIAHSLGALTVALWAANSSTGNIAGAFLVAPPNPLTARCQEVGQFGPTLPTPVRFPSLVVGSENDPWAAASAVKAMANEWRGEFWNAGRVGHINVDSGHGDWPEGLARFQTLFISSDWTNPDDHRILYLFSRFSLDGGSRNRLL